MTNQQLTLLLNTLLAELDTAIEAARDAMPEGAERTQHTEYELKPEYMGKYLIFDPISVTHNEIMVDGDYTAIAPLTALRGEWAECFGVLESEDE